MCQEAISLIQELAGDSADIKVRDVRNPLHKTVADRYSVKRLPAVAIAGKLTDCSIGSILIGRVHVDASLATASALQGTEFARAQCTTIRLKNAQDRSADPRHRPPDLDSDGRRVSLCQRVCSDLREPPENPATLLNVSARTSHPFRTLVGIAVSANPLSPCHSLQHQSLRLRFSAQLASLLPRHRSGDPYPLLPIARFAIILEKCGLDTFPRRSTSDNGCDLNRT